MIKTLYEPFQHWAEKGSVYLFSDPHFDDPDCRKMDPEWISPQEQVEIINKMVMPEDTFICLGDVGDPGYIRELRCRHKVLILGNHDKKSMYQDCFEEIYEGPLFISEKILLSHEPVAGLPWCLNIHGHDHSNTTVFPEGCHHLNLAANVCGYKPVSLGKLIKGGILSGIDDIHRTAIDRAVKRKQEREA